MEINRTNFFKNTLGTFVECEIPNRKPDYVSMTSWGTEISAYFYTNEGVIRVSDHWGGVASCQWNLNTVNERGFDKCRKTELKAGYISFEELTENVNIRMDIMKAVQNGNIELRDSLRAKLSEKF